MRLSVIAALVHAAFVPVMASAQTAGQPQSTVDPTPGRISFAAAYDFTNAYMFRGLRQDDARVIMFPFAEARVDLHDDDDGLTDAALRIGTWNSLNPGLAGTAGRSGKLWYESRFYSTVDFTFDPGITVAGTYTAYTSPNNSFSTVKEMAVRVAGDERIATGGFVLRPHALLAFEFDTAPGLGQADGGQNGGTYLQLGVSPGITQPDFALAFPVTMGLSIRNYYELAGVDHKLGFVSLGALASVPVARSGRYGAVDVRGGFEFQALGNTPEAFNGGEQLKMVGVLGLGFSY